MSSYLGRPTKLSGPYTSTIQFEGKRDQLKHCVVIKSPSVALMVCRKTNIGNIQQKGCVLTDAKNLQRISFNMLF